ncbi:hypothetical protein ACQP00_41190 [Dactylosporangium sp. CS-047395]|uniref:hypothetical protein n=1 Tax=Dactylosporangium sp. CS-047395 TaxID=3239936 RepID=UPI003D90F429
MERDLHTLLTSVRDGAPPPRLSVDDITAAGRHLVRRRRRLALASSAGGGAVTAIAVVAAALMLGGSPRPLTPAVDPSSLPSAASAMPTAFAEAAAFNTTYRGYQSEGYQVSDPELVTVAYQQSAILPGNGPRAAQPSAEDSTGPDPTPSATPARKPGVPTGGSLVVYRPDAFEPAVFEKGGEKISMPSGDGLLAYSGANGPAEPDKALYGRDAMIPTLAWQYSDGAWAAIYWSAWESVPDRDHLIAIAEGLAPSAPQPFPVAFRAAVMPKGYQLLSASYGSDLLPMGMAVSSAVRLTAKPPELPIYEPFPFEDLPTLTLATGRSDAGRKMAGNLTCDGQIRCVRIQDSGDMYVSAELNNAKLTTSLTQITLSMRPQSLNDTSAWPPVVKVFP